MVQLQLTPFAAVTGALAVISLAAAYVPAFKSAKVDPATVLRSQ